MTQEEQLIITNSLKHILRFYKLGELGAVIERGGFVERFTQKYPELAQDHTSLLWTLDSLIFEACNAGRIPPQER